MEVDLCCDVLNVDNDLSWFYWFKLVLGIEYPISGTPEHVTYTYVLLLVFESLMIMKENSSKDLSAYNHLYIFTNTPWSEMKIIILIP